MTICSNAADPALKGGKAKNDEAASAARKKRVGVLFALSQLCLALNAGSLYVGGDRSFLGVMVWGAGIGCDLLALLVYNGGYTMHPNLIALAMVVLRFGLFSAGENYWFLGHCFVFGLCGQWWSIAHFLCPLNASFVDAQSRALAHDGPHGRLALAALPSQARRPRTFASVCPRRIFRPGLIATEYYIEDKLPLPGSKKFQSQNMITDLVDRTAALVGADGEQSANGTGKNKDLEEGNGRMCFLLRTRLFLIVYIFIIFAAEVAFVWMKPARYVH